MSEVWVELVYGLLVLSIVFLGPRPVLLRLSHRRRIDLWFWLVHVCPVNTWTKFCTWFLNHDTAHNWEVRIVQVKTDGAYCSIRRCRRAWNTEGATITGKADTKTRGKKREKMKKKIKEKGVPRKTKWKILLKKSMKSRKGGQNGQSELWG